MMNGCNNKTKLIVETNNIPEKSKETKETKEENKLFVKKHHLKKKILKKTVFKENNTKNIEKKKQRYCF